MKIWQRSSVVEQGTHKPLVSGPNPLVASFDSMLIILIPTHSFVSLQTNAISSFIKTGKTHFHFLTEETSV
jgi:hypothetical protein